MLNTDTPVSGLGPGVMLLGTGGEIPVEWLTAGDKLITRDHGAQPVLHVARLRKVPDGRRMPRPLVFLPGEYGPSGRLEEKLRVAPGTRGLVKRPECELQFGTDEVLARFCDLSRRGEPRIDPTMGPLSYHLIVMERHEIINAGSLWVESCDADTAETLNLPPAVRRATRLLDDIGGLAPRMCLTQEESVLLRQNVPPELGLLDLLAA